MGLIDQLGKEIFNRFWLQGKILLRVEVADNKGRGSYQWSQFKSGTYLIPSD